MEKNLIVVEFFLIIIFNTGVISMRTENQQGYRR